MRDLLQVIYHYIGIFFVIYMLGYASFLFLSVTVGSSFLYSAKQRNKLKNELLNDYYIPISILVPAYNESVTICSTIESLLALDYKLFEIIIIDDGSKDDTSKVVIEKFNMVQIHRPIHTRIKTNEIKEIYETQNYKVPITLIKKANGGKSDALNVGINASQFPYFLCLDADSVLQKDSLEKIVRPVLEEDNVVAVGGSVRPCNGAEIENGIVKKYRMPNNILASMQVLEYDRSFLASRILFDRFNGNIIISGAFGLFKKNIVISAGGYDISTMGEDMELVVKLHVYCREHMIPYRISYATDAICWTQVPERLRDLLKQRRRWHIGLFQSMTIHHRILANPKYGLVSFISYFYFLIYELLSPYIEVFGVFVTIMAYYLDFLNIPFMVLYMGIYIVYSSVLSLTAFFARIHTVDMKLYLSDIIKAIGLCALEVSCLRFVLSWIRMTALIGYKKKKKNWGRIERKNIQYSNK